MRHCNMLGRGLRSVTLGVAVMAGSGSALLAQGGDYTVNGAPVAPEMGALLQHYGFEPGGYYIDANGNYGRSGGAPMGNFHGGSIRGWSGTEPTSVDGNPYAEAYVGGVAGVRVFWVYSPSIFSDIKGGSSGYVHICPGNVYHASQEGAISMGGGYTGREGDAGYSGDVDAVDDPWVGMAGQGASSGRWEIETGPEGPVLALYNAEGGAQRVPIATMIQGSWKHNQTKYAVEVGKASC